eukprot:gene8114-12575_t
MKFGNTLKLHQKTEWSSDYIDFDTLKRMIKKNLIDETKLDIVEFYKLLETELEKVELFYKSKENEIKENVKDMEESSKEITNNLIFQQSLHQISEKIATLQDYVQLNTKGFEKITKKFNKNFSYPKSVETKKDFMKKVKTSYFATSTVLKESQTKLYDLIIDDDETIPDEEVSNKIPKQPEKIKKLNIKGLEGGKFYHFWYPIFEDPLAEDISIPIIIAKGVQEGPILGITVALHGNEINGIVVVHRLMEKLDLKTLNGTVVAIPVCNPLAYGNSIRYFNDGIDLNSVFPGKEHGSTSEVYVYRLFTNILTQFEYLIDMHTASHGRINSLYVRSDMNDLSTSRMALLHYPEIIVHNTSKTTLRGTLMALGIKTITIEIGNPSVFQEKFIAITLRGVWEVMKFLTMIPNVLTFAKPTHKLTICSSSYWIYTDTGGVLTVHPALNTWVKKGELVAEVHTIFGKLTKEYFSPDDGIIVGKATNPIAQSGDRIMHIGIVSDIFKNTKLKDSRFHILSKDDSGPQ